MARMKKRIELGEIETALASCEDILEAAAVAVEDGIKALGGAKIVLREADAGDSVEKAVSAAQRVLTREKIERISARCVP